MGRRRLPQFRITRLMAVIGVVGLLLAWSRETSQSVEKLRSPVSVLGWSEKGLRLADARIVQLPGFASLPVTSPLLTEATKRGVEISEDGRMVGLIRIHHFCGNDKVRNQIARVDLAQLLMYLGEGTTLMPFPKPAWPPENPSRSFSGAGWRIDEFLHFDSWRQGIWPDAPPEPTALARSPEPRP